MAGPKFVAVIVYVITSPTLGVALSTTFVKTISASDSTTISSIKSSPSVVGSSWSPVADVVVFTIESPDVPVFTVAWMFNETLVPLATSPIVHNPDPELYPPDESSLA